MNGYLKVIVYSALVCVIALTSLANAEPEPHFITADGNRFMLNGEEYKAVGMCNYPFSFGNLDYTTRTTRRAKASGITLIRGCITFDNDFSEWNSEEQWKKIDWLLKTCAEEDMHVMIDLSGFRTPLTKGLSVDCWAPESYTYWDELVDFATSRINTFTGIAYKDDPVIFQWLISGEPVPYGFTGDINNESRDVDDVEALFIHVAERLQDKAPNHLISTGGLLHMSVPHDSSGQDYWKTLWSHSAIDCGAIHIYLSDYTDLPGGSWNQLDTYKEYCDSIGKPFVLEEWGINIYDNSIEIAEDYYTFGFNQAYDNDIPITINWDWAPYGGFSVFPAHGKTLMDIVSTNSLRWGYTGPIYEYMDPPFMGSTLWDFESNRDNFNSTNYGGNDGAVQRSTVRAASGQASLRIPVDFPSTNWNFAGVSRYCNPRFDWSEEQKIACDIWVPSDAIGLVVKYIVANDAGGWTNYPQRAEINNWLEPGKWNTVYANLASEHAMDWSNYPPQVNNVVVLTVEVHHSHGTPTFTGDIFLDNVRVGDFQEEATPMSDVWTVAEVEFR